MKDKIIKQTTNEFTNLCAEVRAFVNVGAYERCFEPICKKMMNHPHAPEPHNLLGIVFEKMGDHVMAMKHFRAAGALDPTYRPAQHNLNIYGTFFANGKCAYDESDLPSEPVNSIEIVYDERGIGRVVSKNRIEYDERGIGHVVRG